MRGAHFPKTDTTLNRKFQEWGPTATRRSKVVTDQLKLKSEWNTMTSVAKEQWLCIVAPTMAKQKPGSFLNRPPGCDEAKWADAKDM